jgi:hypothetical protein
MEIPDELWSQDMSVDLPGLQFFQEKKKKEWRCLSALKYFLQLVFIIKWNINPNVK